ncbi:MAG: cyclic nucleotide-binding domain-containing protein [Lachnospiraceae bacterium]|nr:cyclic nucleotide-binding domain-containing protein [Lachnospiraceae bacterium]MBO4669124.1 cyclic nucleotide-binding domain-containing protein [Lachnospiraceae bacterium]
MDYKESLRSFPLLADIDEADLDALSSYLHEKKFSAGTDIVTEGDDGDVMFLLLKGSVDIIKKTVFGDSFVVTTLDDSMNCVFGEMAMIDHDKRSSTVRAKTDCVTMSVNQRDFDQFCTDYPKCGVKLLRLISINLVRNIRKENENLKLVYQALIEEIEKG